MYCLLMTAASVLAQRWGRQLEESTERRELAWLCRGHVASGGTVLGAQQKCLAELGGMGFTWGGVWFWCFF